MRVLPVLFAMTLSVCTIHGPGRSQRACGEELSADALLARARAARAVWEDFPGFSADLVIQMGSESQEGRITVGSVGTTKLEMPSEIGVKWANFALDQLIDHRMPTGDIADSAKYADEDARHPLGRLIKLDDPRMGSAYRVQDDVIREVNRAMGPTRFSISVLDVQRNAEKKYLPRFYTVTFWDQKSGDVASSRTYYQSWKRYKMWDLPVELTEVESSRDKKVVKVLRFSNHQLTVPKKSR